MNINAMTMRQYLSGSEPAAETSVWLQEYFLPALVVRINSTDVRRRLGLYGGDRIPENERNLTDARNRVSLILEYEIARVTNDLLTELGIEDLFVSYVVANRFPDLEVRRQDGSRGLRLEIKGLQTVAEEKSANFDTLKKDLRPSTDFLLVFLWEWGGPSGAVRWDRAPHVAGAFAFNASALAHLRDWHWLHKPPSASKLGNGVQGFDLRYAVNCNGGAYNEEEGNYGKLLRIWEEGFDPQPLWTDLLRATAARYKLFMRECIELGFDHIACSILGRLGDGEARPILHSDGRRIGWTAAGAVFTLGSEVHLHTGGPSVQGWNETTRVYTLTERYSWTEHGWENGRLLSLKKGKKPKTLTPGRSED